MEAYKFEKPSLQSAKGIAVIFVENLYKVIKNILPLFLVVAIGIFKNDHFFLEYQATIIIVLIFVFISVVITALLKYYTFKFHIDNNHFILNKGIFRKEVISIQKSKIQNIHIKQNFVQQILNVVALNIETAGDDTTEIEIKAISKPMALVLKEVLLINDKYEVDEATENDNLYFKISLKQLILEGVSENHLTSVVLVLALLSGIYDTLRDFIKFTHLGSFNLSASGLFESILFNIFLFVLLLFLGFLYSLLKIFILNFNLKVVNTKAGLEISKGLLNKVSLHVQKNKIQNIRLRTNRLKKYFSLYSLQFSQIMESKKQKEYMSIIALDDLQAHNLIDKFYKGFSENSQIHKPEKYFMRVLAIQYAIPLLLLNIPLYFVSSYLILLNIPLLTLLIWHINQSYKKNYFSIDENYFISGSGNIIDTITDYLELKSIQSVEFKQTIFQKKRHLASVVVYTAANHITIPHIKVAMAQPIVNYLLFKTEVGDKNWM
ncbi:PH domain-containing protein [Mariniflexile sp.]|uniref:PH domain-containing protein n=1 Tax=Mariniflexile sp. TaxID=1979402 RepID=UPI0035632A3F